MKYSKFYFVLITLTLLALRRPVLVVEGAFLALLLFDDRSKSFFVDFVVFFVEVFFFDVLFLLDFLAANNSIASSIEISSALLPSGREAFTLPCLTYKP